ncbi:hypothetical protein [Sinorhizobium fredii]|uniref:hypothetical protein n=1 Tax=Rhizobium fredii TaxID=380 RepID=UPI00351357CB
MRSEITMSDALTFCVTAPTRQVERVAEAAQQRLKQSAEWKAWRVFAVDIKEESDELVRINVFADPADGRSTQKIQVFSFLVSADGKRRSPRFEALLVACGILERCDDTREIEGRYFADRNGGRTADDFGSLKLVL